MSDQTFSIEKLSKMMAKQEKAMLVTRHGDDSAVRPMSNNRDVEFDGDTFFFTHAGTTTVGDIEAHNRVAVTYQDTDDDIYVALSGSAKLHTDRAMLEKHWQEKLSDWFPGGVDEDGLTLIEVNADRVHYWIGCDSGELTF